jgi:DNA-binding LacI/PurR family transcriptional regulator
MKRMGQLAMEHLLMLISGEESVVKIRIESELIVRESTARVKQREPRVHPESKSKKKR